MDKLILKFMKNKQLRTAKTVLKSNKTGLIQFDFKTDKKATAIKTVWFWQWYRQRSMEKNRELEQTDIHVVNSFSTTESAFNKLYWNNLISISKKKNFKTPNIL